MSDCVRGTIPEASHNFTGNSHNSSKSAILLKIIKTKNHLPNSKSDESTGEISSQNDRSKESNSNIIVQKQKVLVQNQALNLEHGSNRPQGAPSDKSNLHRLSFSKSSTTLNYLKTVLSTTVATPSSSAFQFEFNPSAAAHNLRRLKAFDHNLSSAIKADADSPLHMGSEFRSVEALKPILGHHPLWPRFEYILCNGSNFPHKPLDEITHKLVLDAGLAFGNHKGATENGDTLSLLLRDEVRQGWAIIVPLSSARDIPGLLLNPMNIADQNTINEFGEIVPKRRLTHDHSYNFLEGSSLNKRTDETTLEPCHFGKAFQRYVYGIMNLRQRFPHHRILQAKYDWKAAYRRMHFHPDTALQCAVQVDEFILLPLRLTFGGKPGPSEFSNASEIACDFMRALLDDDEWDHTDPAYKSPHTHKVPPPDPIKTSDPPLRSAEASYHLPPGDDTIKTAVLDQYIDDTLMAFVESPELLQRTATAACCAYHLLGRPLDKNEPIPRDDLLSLKKFAAEAKPEEIKQILGNRHAKATSAPAFQQIQGMEDGNRSHDCPRPHELQSTPTVGRQTTFCRLRDPNGCPFHGPTSTKSEGDPTQG
jgi:hypothetical protein